MAISKIEEARQQAFDDGLAEGTKQTTEHILRLVSYALGCRIDEGSITEDVTCVVNNKIGRAAVEGYKKALLRTTRDIANTALVSNATDLGELDRLVDALLAARSIGERDANRAAMSVIEDRVAEAVKSTVEVVKALKV